ARRGPAPVRGHRAGGGERAAAAAARVRGRARAGPARPRRGARAQAGRSQRPRSCALRPRRSRGARGARASRMGHLQRPPASVAGPLGPGGDPMTVEAAYAEVERITRRKARNFAYGIMVLPRPKRRAIAAIYAFARRVDDIADGELPDAEKRARLEELHAALDDGPAGDPVFVALADARAQFPIPAAALHDLVDGGLMDTERNRYDDFEQLHGYCKHVAGAVGVACVAVYGSEDTKRAEALGVALQLINIIRDVREDW